LNSNLNIRKQMSTILMYNSDRGWMVYTCIQVETVCHLKFIKCHDFFTDILTKVSNLFL